MNDSGQSDGIVRDPWYFQRWAYARRVGNATRKLVLMSLAASCESGSGYGWVIPDALVGIAECSHRTVLTHLAALEDEGLIARRHEYREGSRALDAFLLLADEWAAWPGERPLAVLRAERVQASLEGRGGNGSIVASVTEGITARPSAQQIVARRIEVPNWEELEEWQRRVVVDLRRFADFKRASLDEPKALAACADFPGRDYVGAAEKFAAWHLPGGRGSNRKRSDTNGAWRKWLASEDPAPVARPGVGVAETGDLSRFDRGED